MVRLARALAGIVVFVAELSLLWHGVIGAFDVKTYFMPMPLRTYAALLTQWPVLQKNLRQTLQEGLAGLALGTVVAVLFAALCVNSRATFCWITPQRRNLSTRRKPPVQPGSGTALKTSLKIPDCS